MLVVAMVIMFGVLLGILKINEANLENKYFLNQKSVLTLFMLVDYLKKKGCAIIWNF